VTGVRRSILIPRDLAGFPTSCFNYAFHVTTRGQALLR
jgi:hypothetical protein